MALQQPTCAVVLASGPLPDNATLTPPPCAQSLLDRIDAGALPLALLMPVHPPKYPMLELFATSAGACGPAIVVAPVFTMASDLEAAVHRVPALFEQSRAWATLPLLVGNQKLPKHVNLPTFKKLLGLRFLFTRTSLPFVMAVDAEMLVVSRAATSPIRAPAAA